MAAQAQTSGVRQSRIGKRPVVVPKGVTVAFNGRSVSIQGPKGKLAMELPERVAAEQQEGKLIVSSSAPGSDAPRLQGLSRALLASMVKGVAEGYERTLELVGTGYRCEVKGKAVNLQVGLSHPAGVELPEGVSATVPAESKGTVLVLASADKSLLGQVAATIRGLRPPEPYGGKGIRFRGEYIRRKAGKAGKGRK